MPPLARILARDGSPSPAPAPVWANTSPTGMTLCLANVLTTRDHGVFGDPVAALGCDPFEMRRQHVNPVTVSISGAIPRRPDEVRTPTRPGSRSSNSMATP